MTNLATALILALLITLATPLGFAQSRMVDGKIVVCNEKVYLLRQETLFYSMDFGVTFTRVPLDKKVRDIHGLPTGTLFILTRAGALLTTTDNAWTVEELRVP